MAKRLVAVTDFSLIEKTADQKAHICKAGHVCKLPADLADFALAKGLVIEETIPVKAGKKKAPVVEFGLGDKNGTDRK